MSNLTIQNNLIHDNSSRVDGLADSNLKYGNGIAIIRIGGDKMLPNAMGVNHLTISGNDIYDNEKNGIYIGPISSNVTITNNFLRDNGMDGVRVDLTEAYYGVPAR